ncbi:MAG: hypothetical protein H7Y60_04600 [Rhodospirillaceae bacterium]|nr:hypothetical protein [Rhodospirillales bacterium]
MIRRLALIFLAAFLACPALAANDGQGLPPQFINYVKSSDHHDAVLARMKAQWERTIRCSNFTFEDYQLMIVSPPEFDGEGRPIKGAWREFAKVNGCGTSRQMNVHMVVLPDQDIRRIATLPGTARADAQLQRDTLMYVVVASSAIIPKDCKDTQITNTEFLGFDGAPMPDARPGMEARPWAEDWTLIGCNNGAVVKVHYIPDATGTTINTKGNETRRIPAPITPN